MTCTLGLMLTPDAIAEFDKRIGANADKLIGKMRKRLYNFSDGKGGPKPSFVINCMQPEMTEVLYAEEGTWPLWLDDPLTGVARLDWYGDREDQVPLSKKNILRCFANLERIDTSTISHLLHLEKRQAARYFKACKLLAEKLIDNYCNDSVRSTRYPAVFIYPREHQTMTDLKEE